jgi:hypothetical protein
MILHIRCFNGISSMLIHPATAIMGCDYWWLGAAIEKLVRRITEVHNVGEILL